MTSIKKVLATLLIGSSVASAASAAPAAVIAPEYHTLQQALVAQNHFVTPQVINNTNEDYWVYSTYYPSGNSYRTYLGPFGASTDIIDYPLSNGDASICFHVDETYYPYVTVYEGCTNYSNIVIDYNYLNLRADVTSKPKGKLVKPAAV